MLMELKWVLQDPNVHTTVPGFTSFDHINMDLAVMEDLTLTDSEKGYLQREASLPGLYCQGCRQCLGQCLEKLPIPDLMRAYMYTYAYGSPAMGRDLLGQLHLHASPCAGCDTCTANCVKGFELRERIADIIRLNDVPAELLA